MNTKKSVVVTGELFWARDMNNFNTMFNPDNKKYQCTIGKLSDADSDKLRELNIKIKNKESQGNFIVGKSQFVFSPVDTKGRPVEIESLGNGSKIVAEVSSYEHRMSAAHGFAPAIKKLTVLEVVTYTPPTTVEALVDDVL
jgi:hypothetical protein